mmetsp:Transcript_421/g.762  ORF Transcript_421/g.762 Transcript_421/m.762 type:complete len:373 (-) Transcript_421:188-1306(-)
MVEAQTGGEKSVSSSSNCDNRTGDTKALKSPRNLLSQRINFTTLTHQSLVSSSQLDVNIQFNECGISTSKMKRTFDTVDVSMLDGRLLSTSLDREGIELSDHCYPHVNYYDFDEVVTSYYPELQQHLHQLIPNAVRIVPFHHQVRSWRKETVVECRGVSSEGGVERPVLQQPKDPVCFAHSDYSLQGGMNRMQSLGRPPLPRDSWCGSNSGQPLLTAEEVQHYSSTGDFMILHAWRNISPEKLQQHPLALCCADSVQESAMLAYDLCYPNRTEGVMAVRYEDSQRWLYHKDLDRNELLLFKQFDTRGTATKLHADLTGHHSVSQQQSEQGEAQFMSTFTPHSSFVETRPEQSVRQEYAGRESIEVAVLVLLR